VLKQITTANVSRLTPAWAFSFGGEKQRGQESQPLIHNGKMFVTASYSRLFALDATTGKKLWKYEHRLPEGIMPCCDVVNRGAALYDSLVIFATLDATAAADQDGAEGSRHYARTRTRADIAGFSLTGVSAASRSRRVKVRAETADDLVAPVRERHMGYTFDKDGNKKENGVSGTTGKSWPGDLWKTGGAATWLGGTYNAKTGLAYFGTGNPAPWNSHLRKGDNLFSCSTVAIDVKTGQIKWHYQGTPNDGWDFDGVNEFITFDQGGRRARRQGRPQWLLLRQRRQHRPVAQRLPLRQKDHLGHRRRPEDRPAEFR
jgi:alcohol dehydrogenase (cytochrome c)